MPIAMLKLIIYLPSKICTKAPASLNIGIFLEVSVLRRHVEIFSCLGAHRHSQYTKLKNNNDQLLPSILSTKMYILEYLPSIGSYTTYQRRKLHISVLYPQILHLHSWFCSVLLTKLHILNGVFRII